jgi:site-specific DNA-methyltransferase (adenine-specific)
MQIITETKGNSRWEGFGTHLKPAHEPIVYATKPFNIIPSLIRPNNNPICMARKPISENTIAENVLKWGTGGINIDGCRVEGINEQDKNNFHQNRKIVKEYTANKTLYELGIKTVSTAEHPQGRFPANLIHDGSDEVISMFPERKTTLISPNHANKRSGEFLGSMKHPGKQGFNDEGSASRFFKSCKWGEEDSFFYTAKAPKDERNMGCDTMEEKEVFRAGHGNEENDDVTSRFRTMMKNIHPTIKPLSLMEYLVKLITQPKGIVLDPFMGSGTTALACKKFGFNFIGFEINEEYCKIAAKRLSAIPKRLDKFGGTI